MGCLLRAGSPDIEDGLFTPNGGEAPIREQKVSVGEDVEKWKPLCPIGGNIKWYGGSSKN